MAGEKRLETATLGGGCFWCMEAVFEQLKGVERSVSGYMGGTVPHPTYQQVCTGQTGHAEVIEVTFDPSVISFPDLLEFFFAFHDPTTLNRQGGDVGTQYRSVVFYADQEQKRIAEEMIAAVNASGDWGAPVVTEVTPRQEFFPAETYHQGYFQAHPEQGYCQAVINPKVVKLRAKHADRLKNE